MSSYVTNLWSFEDQVKTDPSHENAVPTMMLKQSIGSQLSTFDGSFPLAWNNVSPIKDFYRRMLHFKQGKSWYGINIWRGSKQQSSSSSNVIEHFNTVKAFQHFKCLGEENRWSFFLKRYLHSKQMQTKIDEGYARIVEATMLESEIKIWDIFNIQFNFLSKIRPSYLRARLCILPFRIFGVLLYIILEEENRVIYVFSMIGFILSCWHCLPGHKFAQSIRSFPFTRMAMSLVYPIIVLSLGYFTNYLLLGTKAGI